LIVEMNKRGRLVFALFVQIASSLFLAGVGVYFLVRPSPVLRGIPVPDVMRVGGWVFVGLAVLILALIPQTVSATARRSDMDEMLNEYRRNKKRP
jgi:hypothetical protein